LKERKREKKKIGRRERERGKPDMKRVEKANEEFFR